MRKILFIVSLVVSLATTLYSQQRGNRPGGGPGGQPGFTGVGGSVIDGDTETPLEYATVALLNPVDSSVVNGSVTNDKGRFRVEAGSGEYLLKVDYIAYRTVFVNNITVANSKPTMMGRIALYPDANLLEGVEVIGEKSTISFELDKKVFTVGQDLANTGSDATEVLDNIPSVAVDVEGNVSLRGSSGVRILIDGKESGISPMTRLRSLPAGSVEKVEIITNPSAKYDAEGMTGIINVIIRKEEQKGFNAALNANTGIPDNYGASVNLNFRKKHINWFANLGGNYRGRPGSGNLYSNRYGAADNPISILDRQFNRGGLSGNVKAGLDYYISPKTQLTGSFEFGLGDDNNDSELFYKYYNTGEELTDAKLREEDESERERQQSYELNFDKQFTDNRQHKLRATIKWEEDSENENSDLLTRFYQLPQFELDNSTSFMERSRNEEGQNELLLQADFTKPFSENGKLEIGGKATFRDIKNDYLVEEFAGNQWQVLDQLSNIFDYNEDISALYAQYGNKTGKLGYQFGLRGENTSLTTLLETTNEKNARDYFKIFPSAFLSFDLGQSNALQLSYSYRTRRPRFWDLNPFFTYSDSENRFSGNPNLDPEYTNSFEFGHLKEFERLTLNTSLYYRHTEDVIQRISKLITTDVTLTQPVNLGKQNSYGAEIIFSGDITNKLRSDLSANFYSFKTLGNTDNEDLDAEGFSWQSRLNTRYKITNDFDAQLRANYRAPRNSAQGRRKGMLSTDLSASKDAFKGKGTFTLSIRDIFNTRKRRFEQETDDFLRYGEFQWRGRSATVGFNYRINQKKQRQRQGGPGDFDGEGGGEY